MILAKRLDNQLILTNADNLPFSICNIACAIAVSVIHSFVVHNIIHVYCYLCLLIESVRLMLMTIVLMVSKS